MKFAAMLWFVGMWAIFVIATRMGLGQEGLLASGKTDAWVKVLTSPAARFLFFFFFFFFVVFFFLFFFLPGGLFCKG